MIRIDFFVLSLILTLEDCCPFSVTEMNPGEKFDEKAHGESWELVFVDPDDGWDEDYRPDRQHQAKLMWFARGIEINIEISRAARIFFSYKLLNYAFFVLEIILSMNQIAEFGMFCYILFSRNIFLFDIRNNLDAAARRVKLLR